MKKSLYLGMAIGFVTGAFLVNNNMKARRMVDDTQRILTEKIERLEKKSEAIVSCACAENSDSSQA